MSKNYWPLAARIMHPGDSLPQQPINHTAVPSRGVGATAMVRDHQADGCPALFYSLSAALHQLLIAIDHILTGGTPTGGTGEAENLKNRVGKH